MTTNDDASEREVAQEIDETTTARPRQDLDYVQTSQRYDPQKRLDVIRSWLAFCLVALLAMAILGAFALVLTAMLAGLELDGIRLIIEVILTPLVALVSAATGFYFGAQLSSGRRKRDQ